MENEILLQLLVFEHATGDVTVQTEVGEVTVATFVVQQRSIVGIPYRFHVGNVGYLKNGGDMSVREAIDKAVSEQFGREVKSEWVKVFPPDTVNEWGLNEYDRQRHLGYNIAIEKMQKETAFTIWRLTVTR